MVEKTKKLTIANVISTDKKNRTKSPRDKSEPIVYNKYDDNVKPLLDKFSKEIDLWYEENPILKKELTYSLPGTDLQSNPRGIETPINNNSMNQTPFQAVTPNISIINSNSQETVYYTSNVNRSFETISTVPSVGNSGTSSGTVSDDKKTENSLEIEIA